jgi:methyl-accepting chemotaxis protein
MLEALRHVAAGDPHVRLAPLGHGDSLNQAIEQLNLLTARLADQSAMLQEYERRAEEFLDLISGMAALDFSRKARVGETDSAFDALAFGLNTLSEALESAIRRQSETAQRLRDAQE